MKDQNISYQQLFSTSVSDLSVILDNQLKMTDHVAALCRSCFFQLRQIRSIRRSLTSDARKTLVNAFVMSRLDYCNSLCHGINEGLLNKLQHIQNAAARLVTDTRKYDHITPVLRDLHWLPICQESSSNWRPWSTNVSTVCVHFLVVSTVCVHPTLQRTAYGCLPLVVGSTCDRLADWNCLFQEHKL